jgi:hypothetical protein
LNSLSFALPTKNDITVAYFAGLAPDNATPIWDYRTDNDLDFQSAMNFAAFQMWFGRAIDLTAPGNLAQFITPDGKLVPPSVAQAYFGQSDFVFDGNHLQFPVNRGTGGWTTLTGELIDIPYPTGAN